MFDCHTILLTIATMMVILVVYSAWVLHKKLDSEGPDRLRLYWLATRGFKSKLVRTYMELRGWELWPSQEAASVAHCAVRTADCDCTADKVD